MFYIQSGSIMGRVLFLGVNMRSISSLLVAAAFAVSAPASAGVVFSDNFNGENGGNSFLNYAGFNNFTVAGQVDLVKSGDYGISCDGACVDLDGSSGPGTITSLSSFAFNAGDTVRLTVDLGGNQRNDSEDDFYLGFSFGSNLQLLNYGFNFANSGDIIVLPSHTTSGITTSSGINGAFPFTPYSIFFTAGSAGTLKFSVGTHSADNIGPLVDAVKLSVTGNGVPEPAAWAMMLAGFGLVGVAMRRREKLSVTFA